MGYVPRRINRKYAPSPILRVYGVWRIIAGMSDLARTPKQIGTLIRRARKKLGWSQTELGAKSGLRQETISLLETGNPAARLETILAVLTALDLEFRIGPRTKGDVADLETLF